MLARSLLRNLIQSHMALGDIVVRKPPFYHLISNVPGENEHRGWVRQVPVSNVIF